MDELHREVEKLVEKVHELDVEQHVLNTNLLALTANVSALTSSVTALSVLINRIQGAWYMAKWIWGGIGAGLGFVISWYMKIR
jgi:hypothetical protein